MFNFLKQEFPKFITASEEMWTSVAGRILVCLVDVLEMNVILFLFFNYNIQYKSLLIHPSL